MDLKVSIFSQVSFGFLHIRKRKNSGMLILHLDLSGNFDMFEYINIFYVNKELGLLLKFKMRPLKLIGL